MASRMSPNGFEKTCECEKSVTSVTSLIISNLNGNIVGNTKVTIGNTLGPGVGVRKSANGIIIREDGSKGN